MSIYATISEIGLKRFGDEAYVEIYVQGVPAHIDYIGPAWDFLPPPVHPDGNTMRAVFFVERGDEKGTPRCGQEYVKPLLMLTGKEYENIRFVDLLARLEESLDRKYGERPIGVFKRPDGTEGKVY